MTRERYYVTKSYAREGWEVIDRTVSHQAFAFREREQDAYDLVDELNGVDKLKAAGDKVTRLQAEEKKLRIELHRVKERLDEARMELEGIKHESAAAN